MFDPERPYRAETTRRFAVIGLILMPMGNVDRWATMLLARERRERGAGTAEYAGLVVLAALILGVLVPVVVPPLKDHVAYGLCRILHAGDASRCESPDAKRYKPPGCMLGLSTDTYGGSVEVLFFKVGKDLTFMRSSTVDNTGKKTVTVTAVDNTTLGVGTGIGVGVHGGKVINAGADASIGADVKVGIGDAWTFKGEHAEGDADHFIGDIREKAAIKSVEHTGPVGWLAGHAYDAAAGPDIPDSDISRTEFSVNANGGVNAGLGIGPPDPKGKHRKQPPQTKPKTRKQKFEEKYDKRGKEYGVTPNANAGVQIDGSEKGVIEHKKNGETSATLMLSGSGTASETHVVGGHRKTKGYTGMIKVTKDKHGTITSMDLTRATTSGGHAQWVTTHLPLTNDADRQAVANYLSSDAYTKLGQKTLNLTWDDMAPTKPPGPAATPLEKLLYDKGQTTKQDYTYDASQTDVGVNVKLGVKLGLGASISNADQKLTGARYLGAPGADGVRRYQNYKECHG